MSRLSTIFETVDTSTDKRQQYLADVLVDSFLYERKLVESKSEMTLHEIETLISEEAIATGSVQKAEIFLEGIHSKIDEGFTDLVKTVYKNVKAFVMSFLTGKVEKAITAFNNTIKAEKAKLISEALLIYEAKDQDIDKEEEAAKKLIKAMAIDKTLNFVPDILNKTGIVGRTVSLKTPNFGKLQGFSVSISFTNNIITLTLISKDKKTEIPFVVINLTELTILVGNRDIKSPMALAVVTATMNHFILSAESILSPKDLDRVKGIVSASGKVETLSLEKFDIPSIAKTDPKIDPNFDINAIFAFKTTQIFDILNPISVAQTPEITKVLTSFTENELSQLIAYIREPSAPENAKKMIEIFKDEKNLQKNLEGINAIIKADLNENGTRVAQALVNLKNIKAPKRTGMTKPGVRKYTVTRTGASAVLNLGDGVDSMVPVFVFNKPAKIIAFYMDPNIFYSIPTSKFLADVLEGFMGIEGEEIISTGFQKKFKGATPTASSIKVNFGGMKNVKVGGTGVFTLKNEKLVYKPGNILETMGVATEEIDTIDGASELTDAPEVENEEKDKDGKKKEAELSQAMKQFQIVLDKSNFKDNLGALSKSLGISPSETEKHLMEFAGKYQGNIPEILSASKLIGGKYAPLTENEFLAYMASLQSILIALSTEFHKEENSKAWLPSMYSKASYSAFLASAITAADVLNDVVNSDMPPVKDKKHAKDKKPTRKEDSKVKASQYESLAKEYPKVAESLTNAFGGKKAKAQQLLMYAIEIDKMKGHINMATLPSVIEANPKFFNGVNIEDKISFVGNLYAEEATIDQINGILASILYNGIENNFREVEPFVTAVDAIIYVEDNGHTIEAFKKIESSAFDQSKF